MRILRIYICITRLEAPSRVPLPSLMFKVQVCIYITLIISNQEWELKLSIVFLTERKLRALHDYGGGETPTNIIKDKG